MQAERGDGRPDGWMDGCQTEKRCRRESETGREREKDVDNVLLLSLTVARQHQSHSSILLLVCGEQQLSQNASLRFESRQLYSGEASLYFFPCSLDVFFEIWWWESWPVSMTLLCLVKTRDCYLLIMK